MKFLRTNTIIEWKFITDIEFYRINNSPLSNIMLIIYQKNNEKIVFIDDHLLLRIMKKYYWYPTKNRLKSCNPQKMQRQSF
jgi:hypothetical protein